MDLAFAGVAGTADVILIPEIPFSTEKVFEKIRHRYEVGREFAIVVVAEGAKEIGGGSLLPVLGAIANAIHDATGVRVCGLPITPDKILAGLKGRSPEPSGETAGSCRR